ncbi:MAG: MBG domain-containing protein, partial [Clostridia bacterium]
LWTSYRGEEIANRVPIANAINAGSWTSEVLQNVAQRPEHILFESTIDGYNYIAYKGDNANRPKVKQTIAPKAVNATYNITPTDFTYKGLANTYAASVSSGGLISPDQTDVLFSFFELSGEATALTETKVTEAKNAGKYRIKMSGLSNGNYALAADNATDFVINPSTVVVTELNKNLTYNGLSQTPRVDIAYDIGAPAAEGSNIQVRGIFPVDIGTTCDTVGLKDPSDNTQKNAGQFYLNLAIASGIAQRNYVPLTEQQERTLFTINRADCTINVVDNQTSEYLGSEVYIQYTISGVNGEDLTTLSDVLYERKVDDTTWAPDQPAFAQTYRATISIYGGKGQLAPNYKDNSKAVTFVINPRSATIAYDATLAASVPYNGTNYDYGKTTLGNIFQNGQDNVACKVYGYQYSKLNTTTGLYENVKYDKITDLTTPKGVKAVGKYKVTADFNGYGNYIIADKDKVKEFEITVANVNIEAKPVAREFGAPNPDMSAEWTYQTGSLQFFADDAVTLTLATNALQYSNVGTYAITLGAVNGPNAANYNVVLTANTAFTVNARQAKFDFTIDGMDALNKVIYNGKAAAVKPVITYPSAGYVEEPATKLTYTVVFTQNNASVTTATNVGTYTATISLTAGSNFAISADSVYTKTFDIIPRVVVLQFANTTDIGLVYGEAAPTFGATDYGFAPDSLTFASEDTVSLTSSSTYKQFGKVGTYIATLTSNADPTNYSVTYPVRNVVVTPKTLGVTVAFNPSLVFNGETKVATGTLVGAVNNDAVSCDITYNALAGAPVNAGVYALAASLANNADGNYVLGALSQTEMTITPAPVTVTFTMPQSMQYDGNVKTPTVTLAGLVTADAAAQPILTYSIVGKSLVEVKNAGTYKCVVSLPEAIKGNYTLNITEQDMTITPIAVNVTLTPPTNVTYDGLEKIVTYELQTGVVLPQEDVQIKLSFMRKGTATAEPVAVDRAIAYGEHTTVVAFGNTNYVVGAGTNACVFTISTATITAVVTMPTDFVYSASAKEVKVVLSGIEPNDIGKVIAVVKYNGADSAINVGAYTVVITLGGEAGAQYAFETITKTFTITQKEISVTFAPPANLVYDGAAKVMGVEFVGVQGADVVKYSLKYGEADSAINAGKYVVTAAIDDANYKLVGVVVADMTVAKADRTINAADFAAVINYNKITITNKSALVVEYNINGGVWQNEAVFVKEIKPLNTFVVNVILKGDSNYNDSNIIVLDNLKTGSNPMWVTAKLGDINAKFGFADIALYLEAVELFDKVAPQDRKAIETAMADATATYNTFVASVKDIIGNAQHNASLANGKPNSYVRQTAFNFANQNGALIVTFVVAGLALVLAVGAVTLSLNKKKGGNKNEEI